MSRVVHFEILADDIERAAKFYTGVFGWKADRWGNEKYILLTTGPEGTPGINGAIMPRVKPFIGKSGFLNYVCTIQVEGSLETYINNVKKEGGKQETPVQKIPNIGTHAYFRDTEGNIFGIMEQEGKKP